MSHGLKVMRQIRPFDLGVSHPDFAVLNLIRDELENRTDGLLAQRFPALVRDAVDFVLDPVNTARTRVSELDNVEKTFIGLKLEHFVRDMLDVPKRLRDLHIAGLDVDIKNTVGGNWSIPEETYRSSEPCLLMAVDDARLRCFLGLIVAKPQYLHGGKGNRDSKRGVSALGFQNIMWVVCDAPFPAGKFSEFDMDRFRVLRKLRGGKKRASQFFRENIRKPIHRSVIQSLLYDQYDYMKRIRGNGGARDVLKKEGIAIVSSYHNRFLDSIGIPRIARDEIMAVAGFTPEQASMLVKEDVMKEDEVSEM